MMRKPEIAGLTNKNHHNMKDNLGKEINAASTILLIEDNPDILENLIEFLEMEGYRVLAANNGKKGVELAIEFIPDLIICDVLMYEMDGYEVLRVLLNTNQTHEIPFIFSTSMSEKVDRAEAMKLGAADYIVKPFELKALLKMIKACLQSRIKSQEPAIVNSPAISHLQVQKC
jgi:DNA-binding response OmpR family regulator